MKWIIACRIMALMAFTCYAGEAGPAEQPERVTVAGPVAADPTLPLVKARGWLVAVLKVPGHCIRWTGNTVHSACYFCANRVADQPARVVAAD